MRGGRAAILEPGSWWGGRPRGLSAPAVRRRPLGRCNRTGRTGCSRRGHSAFRASAFDATGGQTRPARLSTTSDSASVRLWLLSGTSCEVPIRKMIRAGLATTVRKAKPQRPASRLPSLRARIRHAATDNQRQQKGPGL
ncbi:hypothetical protein GCM10010415_46560 [Streptomyces atrovirens]